jgi:peptidyl-prolyl cis-trans isomerase C
MLRFVVSGTLVLALTQFGRAQTNEAVAARVNGQPISEAAVRRGLRHLPSAKQLEARTEVLDFLITNALIDQYLVQTSVVVTPEETAAGVMRLREELRKSGKEFSKALEELAVSEDELTKEITADLRWEKYCDKQATDTILKDIFVKNMEMFDGTLVRARHILLKKDSPSSTPPEARLVQIRKQIDDDVRRETPKLDAISDPIAREHARKQLLEDAFASAARRESACPSKQAGGDLGWFPRSGTMVEPFARAAFAMKTYEISDAVQTPAGCHLILVTDRRPGKETKFEDVREIVKAVYCEKLREYMSGQLRPRAQIAITPAGSR